MMQTIAIGDRDVFSRGRASPTPLFEFFCVGWEVEDLGRVVLRLRGHDDHGHYGEPGRA